MGALVRAAASGEADADAGHGADKNGAGARQIIETAGLKSAFENWKRRSANDAEKTALETGSLGFAEIQRPWRRMIGTEAECEVAARALIDVGQTHKSVHICISDGRGTRGGNTALFEAKPVPESLRFVVWALIRSKPTRMERPARSV